MRSLDKVLNAVFMVGAIVLLIGSATYITGWHGAFYLYTFGACAFSGVQLFKGYDGDNIIIRRLRFQQVAGALLLLCTAILMAMQTFNFGFAHRNEWVVCLSVACVLELYTAFRIPAELEREKGRSKRN